MKPTILIIEDESGIVDNIVYALKTEGFETTWCSTGMEGLEMLRSQEITLVLLDIGLPDINGFELFKELRKKSDAPVMAGGEIIGVCTVSKPWKSINTFIDTTRRNILAAGLLQEDLPEQDRKKFITNIDIESNLLQRIMTVILERKEIILSLKVGEVVGRVLIKTLPRLRLTLFGPSPLNILRLPLYLIQPLHLINFLHRNSSVSSPTVTRSVD